MDLTVVAGPMQGFTDLMCYAAHFTHLSFSYRSYFWWSFMTKVWANRIVFGKIARSCFSSFLAFSPVLFQAFKRLVTRIVRGLRGFFLWRLWCLFRLRIECLGRYLFFLLFFCLCQSNNTNQHHHEWKDQPHTQRYGEIDQDWNLRREAFSALSHIARSTAFCEGVFSSACACVRNKVGLNIVVLPTSLKQTAFL